MSNLLRMVFKCPICDKDSFADTYGTFGRVYQGEVWPETCRNCGGHVTVTLRIEPHTEIVAVEGQ